MDCRGIEIFNKGGFMGDFEKLLNLGRRKNNKRIH